MSGNSFASEDDIPLDGAAAYAESAPVWGPAEQSEEPKGKSSSAKGEGKIGVENNHQTRGKGKASCKASQKKGSSKSRSGGPTMNICSPCTYYHAGFCRFGDRCTAGVHDFDYGRALEAHWISPLALTVDSSCSSFPSAKQMPSSKMSRLVASCDYVRLGMEQRLPAYRGGSRSGLTSTPASASVLTLSGASGPSGSANALLEDLVEGHDEDSVVAFARVRNFLERVLLSSSSTSADSGSARGGTAKSGTRPSEADPSPSSASPRRTIVLQKELPRYVSYRREILDAGVVAAAAAVPQLSSAERRRRWKAASMTGGAVAGAASEKERGGGDGAQEGAGEDCGTAFRDDGVGQTEAPLGASPPPPPKEEGGGPEESKVPSPPPSARPSPSTAASTGPFRTSPELLLVLDLEGKDEICEFPVLVLRHGREVGRFHRFVRPLYLFAEEPGFIKQGGFLKNCPSVSFSDVIADFSVWLKQEFGIELGEAPAADANFCFVTCGDWDCGKQIPTQAEISGIPAREILGFSRFTNLKKIYSQIFERNMEKSGMRGMLSIFGWLSTGGEGEPLWGFHHSGMHDVENIAMLLLAVLPRLQVQSVGTAGSSSSSETLARLPVTSLPSWRCEYCPNKGKMYYPTREAAGSASAEWASHL